MFARPTTRLHATALLVHSFMSDFNELNFTVLRCSALKVARSRARFFRGDRDILLYTGRAHFFNRYCIRGIHHLIFYSLPECPQFYPELVNLLEVRFRVFFNQSLMPELVHRTAGCHGYPFARLMDACARCQDLVVMVPHFSPCWINAGRSFGIYDMASWF